MLSAKASRGEVIVIIIVFQLVAAGLVFALTGGRKTP